MRSKARSAGMAKRRRTVSAVRSGIRYDWRKTTTWAPGPRKIGAAWTGRSTGRFGGFRAKTRESYIFEASGGITLAPTYTQADKIQYCLWYNSDWATMLGLDSEMSFLAASHEFFKIDYLGVEIQPQFSSLEAGAANWVGDILFLPVTKNSTYQWIEKASDPTPLFSPDNTRVLMSRVDGARRVTVGYDFSPKRMFQGGMSYESLVTNPGLGSDATAYHGGVIERCKWQPTTYTTFSLGTQTTTPLTIFFPGVVFTNFQAPSAGFPFRFIWRYIMKVSFKDRKLILAQNTRGGAPTLDRSRFKVRAPGCDVDVSQVGRQSCGGSVPEEKYEDEDWAEEDEKKLPGPSDPPPPKVAKTVSNSGLVRQLTNIGLGDQPPLSRGTGLKRVTAAVPMT